MGVWRERRKGGNAIIAVSKTKQKKNYWRKWYLHWNLYWLLDRKLRVYSLLKSRQKKYNSRGWEFRDEKIVIKYHSPTLRWLLPGSSLEGFVHSWVRVCGLEILGRLNRDAKKWRRHPMVLAGPPREFWVCPHCTDFLWSLNTPIHERGRKRKWNTFCLFVLFCFVFHDKRNKVITILMPKTRSNHTLG